MKKKLLLFAQFCEAEFTIHKLGAKPDYNSISSIHSEEATPALYTYPQGYIVLTGMGINPALIAVAQYTDHVDEIWNLGFAGSLRDRYPLGSIQKITSVSKYLPFFSNLDPQSQQLTASIHPPLHLTESSQNISLISSDFPIHDFEIRRELSPLYDLVDMEGYGVAFAASYFKKPCTLYKVVSDFASPHGRALLNKNKRVYSEQLACVIVD